MRFEIGQFAFRLGAKSSFITAELSPVPSQDHFFEADLKDAKKATSDLIKQIAGTGLTPTTGKVEIAPSHAHFKESVTNLATILSLPATSLASLLK